MAIKDFARQAVPTSKSSGTFSISIIYLGLFLSMPVFMLGAMIAQSLGIFYGFLSSLTAGIILAIISSFSGWIGAKTRLSTSMISKITFGRKGSFLFNLFLATVMFLWVVISLIFFRDTLSVLYPLGKYSQILWTVFGGLIVTVVASLGFKGLYKLNTVLVPLMGLFLLWLCGKAIYISGFGHIFTLEGSYAVSFSESVAMQLTTWIFIAVLMPDFTRYVKHPSEGTTSGLVTFFLIMPFVMLLSMIPSLALGSTNIFEFMVINEYRIFYILFMILLFWSTAVFYLYSSSLSFSAISGGLRKSVVAWTFGILAILLVCFKDLYGALSINLMFSVIVSALGGTYIGDFLSRGKSYVFNAESRKMFRIKPIIGFAVGALVAFCTLPAHTKGLELFTLTEVPSLDAFIVSMFFTKISNKMFRSKRY